MILGFWMLINGEKQKAAKAPEIAQNIPIPIGPKNDPIELVKRSEIDDYLTPEFYMAYEIFENFKLGFGLPGGLPWDKLPKHLIDLIKMFMREDNKLAKG